MKIRIILTLVLSTLLFLSGCANNESDIATKENFNEVIYFGKTEEWLATFSIFQVRTSLFDSIYIQNIGEDREAEIGTFEYTLAGGEGFKAESSFPQKLQGVRSFQVSGETNAEIFTIEPNVDGEFILTIRNRGKTETITLSRITK